MDKNKFTFGMLSYNQEQYVIEHMESIKYQVTHYGQGYQTYFLLCDDASKDQTVEIIREWLNEESIFDDVQIIVAPDNQGIVANYITALKNIKTDHFKLLGGDDVYFENNIYEASEQEDFVITPVLRIYERKILNETTWWFKRYLYKKKQIKKLLQHDIKYIYALDTPGIFWNHIYATEDLYKELNYYKWCEDLPCWNYLIHLKPIQITILEKPYILYRTNCGISMREEHSHNREFLQEEKKVHKKVFINRYKYPAILNPYRYLFKMKSILYKCLICKNNKVIKDFENKWYIQTENATAFYDNIYNSALKWLREHKYNNHT